MLEIELLTEAVFRRFGFDFRRFAKAPLEQKLATFCRAERVKNVSLLQAKVLHDEACFERLLAHLTAAPQPLFREPSFFRAFRETVVPMLRTYPTIRIWTPACGSGSDAFSLAIILDQEGLLARAKIYATDAFEKAVAAAAEGRLAFDLAAESAANFTATGCDVPFSRYVGKGAGGHRVKPALRKRVFFATHNLATDASFNEFHVVVCRDALLPFDTVLQARAHGVFLESLAPFGYLALGDGETLAYQPVRRSYEPLDEACGLWRRVAA